MAFEDTLDWMVGHLQRNPGAHVYHYAPYEITSLRRLSTLHASREEALDELLRQRRFVDLYGILRQAIRTSEDNLSLKTMEVFFAEAREGMVTKADQSVVEYKDVTHVVQAQQVTGFAGVPSTFALLMHRSNLAETALPALRYVTQAGGNMPPQKVAEWLEKGPAADFFVMYGATEAAARLTYVPPARLRDKLGSIGVPIPSVTIHIVREDGTLAAAGETGELVANGPNIAQGYWQNDTETAERFGPLGYRTGDLGYADADGFLFLVGRKHDMIKVGAHRVGAKEIEDVLNEHASIAEAAVVAAPHEMNGEVPIAFVTLKDTLADAERALQAHCAARLAPHKVPVRVIVEHDLPKLAGTGKLDKRTLRERALTVALPAARR